MGEKSLSRSWLDHMRQTYGLPLVFLVGFGYWLQGFRCFPWLAVSYYLKDNLNVDPGTLQFLQQSSSLPFLAKPIYGLISDSVYIRGAHRVPYLITAGMLQALSWGTIVFFPTVSTSVGTLALYLTLSNLGVAIGEMANDAIVAEFGKRGGSTSELQSFSWLAFSTGALLGNLLAGLALNRMQALAIFNIFFCAASVYLAFSTLIDEKSLAKAEEVETRKDREKGKQSSGAREIVGMLRKRPGISRLILWFTCSIAVIPSLLGSIFFYQAEVLKVDSFYLGLSKMVGQIGLLLGSVVYNRWLKDIKLRKIVAAVQSLIAFFTLLDLVLVRGFNQKLGLSDEAFVVAFSGVTEAISQFKILPVMVAISKQCPPGTEGTILSIFSACVCLANIISGYFGVALAAALRISSQDFHHLGIGIVIEAALAFLPAIFVWYLPDEKAKKAA